MDENTIRIIPYTREKEKWCTWLVKFMARSGIKGYHVILIGAKEILSDDADEKKIKKLLHLSY